MSYYIDLFSPETYAAFTGSSRDVSGFRLRHQAVAGRIKAGDYLVCYVTRLSRWCGILKVVSGPFIDETPIFQPESDPFVVRFKVEPTIWLDLELAIPIHEDGIWSGLTFTRELDKNSLAWTGRVRGSLGRLLDDQDGSFLHQRLAAQSQKKLPYPIDEAEKRKIDVHTVVRPDKVVSVSIPDASVAPDELGATPEPEVRESIRMQAMVAKMGSQMGFSIWLPRADRVAVLKELKSEIGAPLERLPLNYDDTTLRTIEQIDVLWLRKRSIIRAFEIEHTTSVYSGILRMADLLALQPNMDIKLHIVAPGAKREKVF